MTQERRGTRTTEATAQVNEGMHSQFFTVGILDQILLCKVKSKAIHGLIN